jgi:putative spermidine/putrescine transport system substrate-binding protein
VQLRQLAMSFSLVLAASLFLAACGGDSAGSAGEEGGTLVVLGSSPDINAAWQVNVDRQFEERTGAKLEWLPGAAPTNLTKLITSKGGQPPADVVFLDTPTQTQAIQAGVLEEFDQSKLTESGDQLPDSAYANEGYGPAGIVIRLGTCVNTEGLASAGIAPPESVDAWFDPALKGHFAMPDISTFYTQATLPALAEHFDVPFDDPGALLDQIQDADPATFWTSTADVQQSLQSGQLWMSPLLDGRCLNLAIQGEPVSFQPLNLDIDGEQYRYVGLFDTWDVVKGTEKADLAHEFIDIALNEASMSELQEQFGYLPARTDLLEKAKADPELKDMVGDYDPEDLYVPDYKAWFDQYAGPWQDAWNQRFKK